jgi:hypothetical protein
MYNIYSTTYVVHMHLIEYLTPTTTENLPGDYTTPIYIRTRRTCVQLIMYVYIHMELVITGRPAPIIIAL